MTIFVDQPEAAHSPAGKFSAVVAAPFGGSFLPHVVRGGSCHGTIYQKLIEKKFFFFELRDDFWVILKPLSKRSRPLVQFIVQFSSDSVVKRKSRARPEPENNEKVP